MTTELEAGVGSDGDCRGWADDDGDDYCSSNDDDDDDDDDSAVVKGDSHQHSVIWP